MTAPATGVPIDTSEMPAVHSFFRRELRLAGRLVRGVDAGDVVRAAVVDDHLDLLGRALHTHHSGEDELLWPLLRQRVPDELAPVVHLMESQHQGIEAAMHQVDELRPRWRSGAAAAERDRLADQLDRLHTQLVEHMDAEEERLLPIAAKAVSPGEWAALGVHARAHGRRAEQMLMLGMIGHEADPAVFARMLSAPRPVRWVLTRLSARAFRAHSRAVHRTATP